jgi:transposase InsO family protein
MIDGRRVSARLGWARLRFSIVGPLLAAPPKKGQLRAMVQGLATKEWIHPAHGELVTFGASTIERWFYAAKKRSDDPIEALARKVPSHAGEHPTVHETLRAALEELRREHPNWTYQLTYDNVLALAAERPEIKPVPSYTTIRRAMRDLGLVRQKKSKPSSRRPGDQIFEIREQRSFEVEHIHALWHFDFHEGSRRVLLDDARWAEVYLLSVLDDRSRICCHAQWYLEEDTESLVHGLIQAFLKRGIPRSILSDNGGPMTAGETLEGFSALSIVSQTTLPRHPEQNGKQENFFATVEGRLMAMLENKKELTLQLLNDATQAWVELDYHRAKHSEINESPLACLLREKSVGRQSWSFEDLRRAFRIKQTRKQRRTDGTISVAGKRFELPSRYRTLLQPTVRYARWDMSSLDLVDPRTDKYLATLLPLDKHANAETIRRIVEPVRKASSLESPTTGEIAPLLRNLMREYSATGLPPAYLTKDARASRENGDTENE